MSIWFDHPRIAQFGRDLFQACGADDDEARTVAEALVQSSLMGHDSHGVIRIPEYLADAAAGKLRPRAPVVVTSTGASTAVVDCGQGFGAVGAERAMAVAVELARSHGTACVSTKRCSHVGRLGAYVQWAAGRGCIALATCNSPVYGHCVLPFGGRAPRLATNPIAYGVPTNGDPVVADFSTSIVPEGKLRVYRNEGKPVPPGWILDAAGQPTTDPTLFYGPPRGGILPLGGNAGHKGLALSMLVEILGSSLAGVPTTDPTVYGNGVCFLVVDPARFCPLDRFRALVDDVVAYIKSSPPAPGFDEVLVPGELEFRTRRMRLEQGIPIDEPTLVALDDWARKLGVPPRTFQGTTR